MFCSTCGTNCNPTQKFCNNCGASLAPVVEPVAPAVEPVAPVVEPVAPVVEPVAPAVEPVAPVVEPVAPVVEPVAPVVEPVAYPCENKLGLAGWISRLLISFLPFIVTYLLILLDSTGMFRSIVKSQSAVGTVAIIFLSIIAASLALQIGHLIYWACSNKHGSAARDWALGFIIVAIGIAVIAVLASLGMHLFHEAYTEPFSFLSSVCTPFRFILNLFASI